MIGDWVQQFGCTTPSQVATISETKIYTYWADGTKHAKDQDFEWDYWKLAGGRYYGVGYDKNADALFDMHQCMRHARYRNMPEKEQKSLRWTTLADKPMQFGELPLIEVKYEE